MTTSNPSGPVLVVDFGAQYAQLIARRIREAEAYSEIVPHDLTAADFAALGPSAIIFSGGPSSVLIEEAPRVDPGIYELGVPILGICYGAQLIAAQNGGKVSRFASGEFGSTELSTEASRLLGEARDHRSVWMSHYDCITKPPKGTRTVASTGDAPVAAFEGELLCGVQFHPEATHTESGQAIFERWLDHAGVSRRWRVANLTTGLIEAIKAQIGSQRAICGLSGGVDSAVAAALVHKAVGSQLTCVFVDTGLMRKDEGTEVVDSFKATQGIDLVHVRAEKEFFAALKGITEPEAKRRVIGERFIRVFERAASQIQEPRFLVQGTLYADVVESGGKHVETIKSHHNVGGLPEDMRFDLVEPLRTLFKDEVRRLGTELGLPDRIVWRQPFPGPGLAVRIIGEVTPDKVAILQEADAVVREVLREAGLEREMFQSFAVLADIRTVGVMGDVRTYGYPIIVRAVTSDDVMTADWARLPHEVLQTVSSRITNTIDGVNRVVYDITSKPPGTIEWE